MRHLKLFLALALIVSNSVLAALPPKPVQSLPVGTASSTNSSDALLYVNTAQSNFTYRLYLWDLLNLPPFASSSYVLGKPLTGFSSSSGTVTSSDTVKTALEKLAGNSTPSAPVSIGTFDSQTPDAKGLALAANVLYGQSATATVPGMVNTGTQTFAGVKTFNSTIAGSINGNAATASALASNPADCAANTFATTIAANGDLTCAAVGDSGLSVPYIKADGTRGLSADWNAGAHNITATGFIGALTGNVTGNADTATALASNPSDCASDTYATTIAANGNLTCSSVSDTGLAVPYLKADGTRGLSGNWNAGAHTITASTFIGAVTGNASTASALAADPSDCASDTYATTIAANGNLTCSSVSDTGLATSYLKADGTRGLSANWNAGAHTITATTFIGALTGNASTATALASNPTDCSPGDFATAIDASGNLTCATPAAGGISALTGDVTASGTGSVAATIAASAVTNAKMANEAQSTFKGRHAGAGTGAPEDMTATQATAVLNLFGADSGSGGLQGLVTPTSAGDAAARRRLGADGNWNNQSNGAYGAINFASMDTSANSWANDKPDNTDAEVTVGDWVAYADAAATVPVDMTGGSPNTTCTRNTSSPLDGAADFKMTVTTAASRQGEGCSLLVNIPVAYRGQALKVSFPYATTGTIAAGDFVPYAYDVTNSSLLAPSTTISGISGTAGTLYSIFSTQTSTAQLRIGLHIARTSTAAATVNFDDVKIAPDLTQANVPLSDVRTDSGFTPSAGFGTVTNKSIQWRRSGDVMEVGGFLTTGTVAGSEANISLPSGYTIDYSKVITSHTRQVGQWVRVYHSTTTSISTDNDHGPVFTDGSDTGKIFFATSGGSDALIKANVNGITSNGDSISFQYELPISGWSSGGGTSPVLSLSDSIDISSGVTFSALTASNVAVRLKRVGDFAEIDGSFTIASPAASAFSINLPSQYKIDSSKISSQTTGTQVGWITEDSFSGTNNIVTAGWPFYLFYDGSTTSQIFAAYQMNSSGYVKNNGSAMFNNTYNVDFHFRIPISGWTSTSSGTLTAPRSEVTVDSGNGHGSGNTKVRRWSNIRKNVGGAITYADDSTNGGSFTINEAGVYAVSLSDTRASGNANGPGIVVNGTALTTSVASLTYAQGLRGQCSATAGAFPCAVSWTGNLNAGDIVREMDDGSLDSTTAMGMFTITKVSN